MRTLAAAALVLALGCSESAAPRPNLLLITIDTLRPDRLACYGGDEVVGTALCDLADHGVRFEWAFSTASSTAPSIASILTSSLPSAHGVTQAASTSLADQALSVAELLADAGYRTAAFVSNPVLDRGRGFAQGFAIYDQQMTHRERNRPIQERDAAPTSAAALAWARVTPSPWFLWVHYQDPHGPYEPPGAGSRPDPAGAKSLPQLTDHSGLGGIPAYQALPGMHSFEAYARRYVDEIRYLDVHLGLLVSGLDALGSRPVVVLTADHGEAFGEDGYYFAHGHSLGLDQIRVPLLVRGLEPVAPRVSLREVSNLDVAPTLLRAAGVAVPPEFTGCPLARELFADGPAPECFAVFAEHGLRAAVISGGLYYARDRRALAEPVRDRVSGGLLAALPPRLARLGNGSALPPYQPAEDVPETTALESRLAAHLDAVSSAAAPEAAAGGAALDSEAREALRALGYLE